MIWSCQALIFDVDGTLADTEELHRQAFNLAFRSCGLDWSWDAPLYADLLRVTGGKERISSYIERLYPPAVSRGYLQARVPEIHQAKTRIYKQLIETGEIRARAGVRRLLLEARRAGLRVAIASTTSPQNIEPLITAGLGPQAIEWFDTIATGDMVANKKPAPDVYNLALRTLRVPAGCAIAVEDSAIGVHSAKAAGLFTVATPSAWTREQDFGAADLLLDSLEPLTLERLLALHAEARNGVVHAQAP